MAQEQNKATMTPDSQLSGGKVRPRSKVKVLFKNSVHHGVPFVIQEIHPALAAKLVEAGKCEYTTASKLTKDQMEANKKALADKIKARGRTPGKAKKNDGFDDDEEEDLVGGKDAAGKTGGK